MVVVVVVKIVVRGGAGYSGDSQHNDLHDCPGGVGALVVMIVVGMSAAYSGDSQHDDLHDRSRADGSATASRGPIAATRPIAPPLQGAQRSVND